MSTLPRRLLRSLTLLLTAAALAGCHFHGHGHFCGPFGGGHWHAPIRHCR
jgi:hypothetical protein